MSVSIEVIIEDILSDTEMMQYIGKLVKNRLSKLELSKEVASDTVLLNYAIDEAIDELNIVEYISDAWIRSSTPEVVNPERSLLSMPNFSDTEPLQVTMVPGRRHRGYKPREAKESNLCQNEIKDDNSSTQNKDDIKRILNETCQFDSLDPFKNGRMSHSDVKQQRRKLLRRELDYQNDDTDKKNHVELYSQSSDGFFDGLESNFQEPISPKSKSRYQRIVDESDFSRQENNDELDGSSQLIDNTDHEISLHRLAEDNESSPLEDANNTTQNKSDGSVNQKKRRRVSFPRDVISAVYTPRALHSEEEIPLLFYTQMEAMRFSYSYEKEVAKAAEAGIPWAEYISRKAESGICDDDDEDDANLWGATLDETVDGDGDSNNDNNALDEDILLGRSRRGNPDELSNGNETQLSPIGCPWT